MRNINEGQLPSTGMHDVKGFISQHVTGRYGALPTCVRAHLSWFRLAHLQVRCCPLLHASGKPGCKQVRVLSPVSRSKSELMQA
jgi:hypothetical protein